VSDQPTRLTVVHGDRGPRAIPCGPRRLTDQERAVAGALFDRLVMSPLDDRVRDLAETWQRTYGAGRETPGAWALLIARHTGALSGRVVEWRDKVVQGSSPATGLPDAARRACIEEALMVAAGALEFARELTTLGTELGA